MRRLWAACGGLGVVLLVPFKAPVTLALGVLLLLAFVGLGVWIIAAPAFLEGDESPPPAGAGATHR
jgi:hypothetical protein